MWVKIIIYMNIIIFYQIIYKKFNLYVKNGFKNLIDFYIKYINKDKDNVSGQDSFI